MAAGHTSPRLTPRRRGLVTAAHAPCGRTRTRGSTTERLASHAEREDVRLLVAALRGGEIITLVRRKAEDSDDKVAIGTNIAPGLVDALKATLAG